jgi:hypothetical protein
MTAPLFASLTAGLLARKGEAAPSKEPSFGHKPWQPPIAPAVPPPVALTASAPVSLPQPQQQLLRPEMQEQAEAGLDIQKMRVRLNEVSTAWPAPKPTQPVDNDGSGWVPNKPQPPLALGSLGAPFKTTIRLTHAQARAVKLAALILDKPQQEILTTGLIERLEALACSDLAKCACYRAVIEGMKTPEHAVPVEDLPLPY